MADYGMPSDRKAGDRGVKPRHLNDDIRILLKESLVARNQEIVPDHGQDIGGIMEFKGIVVCNSVLLELIPVLERRDPRIECALSFRDAARVAFHCVQVVEPVRDLNLGQIEQTNARQIFRDIIHVLRESMPPYIGVQAGGFLDMGWKRGQGGGQIILRSKPDLCPRSVRKKNIATLRPEFFRCQNMLPEMDVFILE